MYTRRRHLHTIKGCWTCFCTWHCIGICIITNWAMWIASSSYGITKLTRETCCYASSCHITPKKSGRAHFNTFSTDWIPKISRSHAKRFTYSLTRIRKKWFWTLALACHRCRQGICSSRAWPNAKTGAMITIHPGTTGTRCETLALKHKSSSRTGAL